MHFSYFELVFLVEWVFSCISLSVLYTSRVLTARYHRSTCIKMMMMMMMMFS